MAEGARGGLAAACCAVVLGAILWCKTVCEDAEEMVREWTGPYRKRVFFTSRLCVAGSLAQWQRTSRFSPSLRLPLLSTMGLAPRLRWGAFWSMSKHTQPVGAPTLNARALPPFCPHPFFLLYARSYSTWNDCSSFRDNGPDGWCWNSEDHVKNTTLYMISSGLARLGYNRINVDEGTLRARARRCEDLLARLRLFASSRHTTATLQGGSRAAMRRASCTRTWTSFPAA